MKCILKLKNQNKAIQMNNTFKICRKVIRYVNVIIDLEGIE